MVLRFYHRITAMADLQLFLSIFFLLQFCLSFFCLFHVLHPIFFLYIISHSATESPNKICGSIYTMPQEIGEIMAVFDDVYILLLIFSYPLRLCIATASVRQIHYFDRFSNNSAACIRRHWRKKKPKLEYLVRRL